MNHDDALAVLKKSLVDIKGFKSQSLTAKQQAAITSIILGSHLTFRYVLITALLAKVVDRRIHMRSLQQGASLTGAYDARSLCHGVWVKFEREHLDNRLGGSNEPYLNKPARFPAVDKSNPVRGGNDRYLLETLYDLLEGLNSAPADQQREAFLFAMNLIMGRTGSTISDLKLTPMTYSADAMRSFIDFYLGQSFGGEVPVSVVGALLQVRYGDDVEVKVHPANQAGSSSNEVGDIDVYEGKTVTLPVEVKDKPFGKSDVDHAAGKSKAAKCRRLLFVIGRSGAPAADATPQTLTRTQAAAGFDLAFAKIDDLVRSELVMFSESQRQQLVQHINRCLTAMRAKDETRRHFTDCLKQAGFSA